MAVELLNQYEGTFGDNSVERVNAESLKDAADILTTVDAGVVTEPQVLRKTHTGIRVQVPTRDVSFVTEATPEGAVLAGCMATPEAYTVKDGDFVIFTAIEGEGYEFVEWQKDGVAISGATRVAKIAVTQTDVTLNPVITYTAIFQLATP